MKSNKEVVPIIPSKDIIVGDADAPVHLVMFGDYESEATAQANDTVKQLLEDYAGKVKFTFRHFPLTRVHQKAHKAAEAAIGAAQEGKFWEMHQYLFERRSNLGIISLKSYAREVGVTDKRFLEHLMNSDYGWFVQDDLKEGLRLGVTNIPALFINGERFEKEATMKNVKPRLEELLKSKRSKLVGLKEKKRA